MGDLYEMVNNLLVKPGYQPSGRRAQNLNTIDEVPDSSWFTNRVGTRPLTIDELVRGPILTLRRIPRAGSSFAKRSPGCTPA